MKSNMTAQDAIETSQIRDEIVHLGWTAERATHLLRVAEDSVLNDDTYEFWGEDDGGTWRIHLEMSEAVEGLRREAAEAGDESLVADCDAWDTTGAARRRVIAALESAAAAYAE